MLVFVGIPVGVFLLMAAAVYGAGSRRSRRYRPGRPFEFAPVWFLAAPERIVGPAEMPTDDHPALEAAGAELTPAGRSGSVHGVKGGASGSW
ncbi:hypothetical protein [Actinocatenispora rupis]|uniref:aa3-type cytochrome oxidase subunit CtaJ n=1 Tax=Actinocatenispora rupis TaxID=519421 RepID=UPI003570D393